MSGDDKKADASVCCASCGIAEIDDIKLKDCDGCDLVRYCGDACQELHRPEHRGKCRKRAAELRDELLFKQPEFSHYGDCPICSLPLSLDRSKSSMYFCCSKMVCDGCICANQKREDERRLQPSCPFCREILPSLEEEYDKQLMKRVEANDPAAMCRYGEAQYEKGQYSSAFEYFTKAAELGDAHAHLRLAWLYHEGQGVEENRKKRLHHFEEAAIGGHPLARYSVGAYEWNHEKNGDKERAVKHWIIAARQGDDNSIKDLMNAFKERLLSKEDLAAALRAQKAAVDATKRPQRKEAEVTMKDYVDSAKNQ